MTFAPYFQLTLVLGGFGTVTVAGESFNTGAYLPHNTQPLSLLGIKTLFLLSQTQSPLSQSHFPLLKSWCLWRSWFLPSPGGHCGLCEVFW